MKSKYYIFTVFVIFLLLHPAVSYTKVDGTSIFISTFAGPKHLGKNVAALMSLEIGLKLQGIDIFDNKKIRWKIADIKISNHQQALEKAKHYNAGFILWGNIFHYGSSSIIQPYLSIIKHSQQTNKVIGVWQETIQTKNQKFIISTDNPEFNPLNRPIIFSPIILNPQIVQKYSSPHALRFISDKNNRIGTYYLKDEFIISRFNGRSALVDSEGKVGQINLPILSEKEKEVFNFVAGMLMLYANDWSAGIERLQSIEQIKGTPTALKIDSLLFQADAKIKSGLTADPILRKAHLINPYYKPTAAYKIVNAFSGLNKLLYKSGDMDKKRKAIIEIDELIKSNHYLFSLNDQWFKNVQDLLRALIEEYISPSTDPPGFDDPPRPKPPIYLPPGRYSVPSVLSDPIPAPAGETNESDKSEYLWKADKQANFQTETIPWEIWPGSRFVRILVSGNAIQKPGNQIKLVFKGNNTNDYQISRVSIAQKKPDGKIGEIVKKSWKQINFGIFEKGKTDWEQKVVVPKGSEKISDRIKFDLKKNVDYYVTFLVEGDSVFLSYDPKDGSTFEKNKSLFVELISDEVDNTDYARERNWLNEKPVYSGYAIVALDSIVADKAVAPDPPSGLTIINSK